MKRYIESVKELQNIFYEFIECNNDDDNIENFQRLINYLENLGSLDNLENQSKIEEFLYLIQKVTNNHHQEPKFFDNVEKILFYFRKQIKQTFSNLNLFNFFKKNKQILLFLFEKEIITLDDNIIDSIFSMKLRDEYIVYFSPEIKPLIDLDKQKMIEEELAKTDFNKENRLKSDNDCYLGNLIRYDIIDDFISHVSQTNVSLSKTTIKPSIYETNTFLIKNKESTLIEYAAFFGSIQIFNYLRMNNVKLLPSLWLYAIHGKNAEIIHLLVENHIEPVDKTYNECLKESIKCHHNEIASFIQTNFLKETQNSYDNNIYSYAFHYHNYSFFPTDFTDKFTFFYLCQYNYFYLVKILCNTQRININDTIIFFHELLMKFQNK